MFSNMSTPPSVKVNIQVEFGRMYGSDKAACGHEAGAFTAPKCHVNIEHVNVPLVASLANLLIRRNIMCL